MLSLAESCFQPGAINVAAPKPPPDWPTQIARQIDGWFRIPAWRLMLGNHVGVNAAAHVPAGGDAGEAWRDGGDDLVQHVVGDLSWKAPMSRKFHMNIFSAFSSMQVASAMYSIVKCAKSGWLVSGQWQVNSGIWM